MSVYVKGNAVANATSYELMEKTSGGVYNSLAEANEINFDVSAMNLAAGDHTLVVKAKADGYEDSDVSNEVVYTAPMAELVNLYSAETSPVGKWYVGNTWSVDSTNTKVIKANNTPIASSSALVVDMIPVESGKTYSFKVYNAPTEIAKSDGTMIPYYGICAMFFHQTIDGKQSVRYAHSVTGSFGEHVSYWNTAKYSTYTGDIPISDTNNAVATFATNNEHNVGVVEITNLATGAVNTNTRYSIFKGAANLTQAVKFKINDETITHVTIVFGNPADGNFITAGVPTADGFSTAIATIQNNLLFVEGDVLPESYSV